MGRETPSAGLPPASFRKAARAKRAKATLNKTIPSLLTAHPRAKKGIAASEVISNPKPLPTSPSPCQIPDLSLRTTDSLTAAHSLLIDPATNKPDLSNKTARVAILNMASALAPGGGALNGASGPEAFLCTRTTLLPSLRDDFYRLPEVGGVWSPDVLVFADARGDAERVLEKRERWFVDVLSAAALRFPAIEVDEGTGRGRYASAGDREAMVEKMRGVMRIFAARGVRSVVLGAWGCGAFGNPVGEVAGAWRRVLCGGSGKGRKGKGNRGGGGGSSEEWKGVEKVVFAIEEAGLADAFQRAFGEGLAREEEDGDGENEEDRHDIEVEKLRELEEKIREMHVRVQQAKSPQLRAGLVSILEGLESQVPKQGDSSDVEGTQDSDTDSAGEETDTDSSDSDAAYDSTGG
ncbi:hypothetical protein WHR41_05806 [Cladosporium halotolerans]|uniref:Microbial-type PARG catalytic domain-containing protein n=1 Tax=Cladosporium halotolerans TaxID=1052096 RepID=A0AB34KNG1_9PEZI